MSVHHSPVLFDQSLSSECVDYSGTSSHDGDGGDAASDVDAYKESYFAPTPDMSKYSHLRLEDIDTVVSIGVSPPITSTGFAATLSCTVLINDLHSTIFPLLIYYAHFAYVGIQLSSLPIATVATLPTPAAASIEVIATSSSTDLSVGPLTRVPPASKPSSIFFLRGQDPVLLRGQDPAREIFWKRVFFRIMLPLPLS